MPVRDEDEQELETLNPELEQEQEEIVPEEDGSNSDQSEDDQPVKVRKPFLEVDERTKYMTREEAVRGAQEAGKRIAQLSAWEKELKEYGDLRPQDVRAYLDELIESRQTATQLQSELKKFKEDREREQTESSNRTQVANEAKLTKEEKDAVEWLKEKMPSLGYISKDEAMKQIKELTEKVGRVDQLEQYVQTQQTQYRNSLIDDSRVKLSGWMKEDSFADNEEGSLRLMIESSIRDWVNMDQRRVDQFYQGGSLKDALLKEGYDRAKSALGMLKSNTGGTYTKNKADALKRNVKRLPNPDITQKSDKNLGKPQKKFNSSGKRDFIGEKHNAAWEKFQAIVNKNEEQ